MLDVRLAKPLFEVIMELKGKKIAFLGDSITYGVGASCAETSYVGAFAKESGAQVFNFGVSGTRIARQTTPSPPPPCLSRRRECAWESDQ